MNCNKFNVPGVTFSTMESGLEIVSVSNKYASAKITTNGAHIFEYIPVGEKDLLWVSKKAFMRISAPYTKVYVSGNIDGWLDAIEKNADHNFIRKEDFLYSYNRSFLYMLNN